jgi:hypothetical protein
MKKKRSNAQIAADKYRTGRPRKTPDDKRTEQVTVYLTKAERIRLEQLAQEEGMTLPSLIMQPWRKQEK